MNITKRQVREALGFRTDVEVADFFGATRQAICAWGMDEPLPEGRQWQALALRPDIFGPEPDPAPIPVKPNTPAPTLKGGAAKRAPAPEEISDAV